MPVDRTEELREAAHAHAQRQGRHAAAQAALAAAPAPPRSDFARAAASVGAAVAALRTFAAARRRDYTEAGRVTEAERDDIEAEVAATIRDCRERIDALKAAAPGAAAASAAAAAAASGRRGAGGEGSGDALAHHTGVVLILAERLADVAERFDRQRAARLRDAAQAATLRRRRAPAPASLAHPAAPPPQPQASLPPAAAARQQLALQESYALAEELTQLVDQTRAAEAKMVEVSALSSTFAAHVAAQAQQIEQLYASACASSRAFERGNAELELTLQRSGGARRTTAMLLLFASLALLLLDWLSG